MPTIDWNLVVGVLFLAGLITLCLLSPWDNKPGAGKRSVEEAAAEMDIRGRMPNTRL